LFLERDTPWYAASRDLAHPSYCRTELYESVPELKARHARSIREADLVIVGSYVPEGVTVGQWVTSIAGGVTAFYDIDTPVTLAKLDRGDTEYLSRPLVMRYDLYLSFTGGPTLERLHKRYRARCARPLYCSVDPDYYYPEDQPLRWDMGYLGTYSADRQPALTRLMLEPALRWPDARFCVAGPQYPAEIQWPANVSRIEHLAAAFHREFYNSQRFTLNLTRADMVRAGYSPSIRLFEAAACGTPIISDPWDGLGEIFTIGSEILVTRCAEESLLFLQEIDDDERDAIGERARARVLSKHTGIKRAEQLEDYTNEVLGGTVLPTKAAV
jgi:spore maturation protein CgeB